MGKSIIILIAGLLFSFGGFCQTKEIIDREIVLIKSVPQRFFVKYKDTKADKHYKAILKLDTTAVPYLIEKITDTTQSRVFNPCIGKNFKVGDIACDLIFNIDIMLWHWVFKGQWDVYACDTFPADAWDYLNKNREGAQKKIKSFLASEMGKTWIEIIKMKSDKSKQKKLLEKFSAEVKK